MQLVGFFAFDMFGLFLEVFIVSQRKLKIDISLSFGQLPEPERSKPTRRKKIIFEIVYVWYSRDAESDNKYGKIAC